MDLSLSDYQALIPGPNDKQPNFMAWLTASLELIVANQGLMGLMYDAFDLSKAVGNQLDILGEILGLPRTLDFQPSGGQDPVLEDDIYKIALYAKILKNQWKGTKQEIYDFWQTFLPQFPIVIQDNQNMSMNVTVFGMPNDTDGILTFGYGPETLTIGGYGHGYWGGQLASILRSMVRHHYFIPKPAGVAVYYSFSETPIFGYGVNSDYLKGYGQGYWSSIST